MQSIDKLAVIEAVAQLFDGVFAGKPEDQALMDIIEWFDGIIPIHAKITADDYDDIDTLFAVYPYIHLKLTKLMSYFVHKTRIARQNKQKNDETIMRAYRDVVEFYIKTLKMQYESLSRRITVLQERRNGNT